MAADDDAPQLIDGGRRYIIRRTARGGWGAALELLAELLAASPPDAYPARVSAKKSDRGARVHLTVVYQRKVGAIEAARARGEGR